MSVMNTHAPAVPGQRPTFGELIQQVLAGIFFVPLAGPPVILLLGPWLLLVMLLIPPAAFLITLALVLLVGAGALVALGALIASPYLLVRHLRARPAAERRRFPFVRRGAADRRSRWLPAHVAPR
jgi:hypothetical protein